MESFNSFTDLFPSNPERMPDPVNVGRVEPIVVDGESVFLRGKTSVKFN